MIMRIFALKDHKIGIFMNPMFFNSRGQVQRVVADEVNRRIEGPEPPTTLQSHPEDLELYEIGEFDNESGVISPSMFLVCQCKDLVIGRS